MACPGVPHERLLRIGAVTQRKVERQTKHGDEQCQLKTNMAVARTLGKRERAYQRQQGRNCRSRYGVVRSGQTSEPARQYSEGNSYDDRRENDRGDRLRTIPPLDVATCHDRKVPLLSVLYTGRSRIVHLVQPTRHLVGPYSVVNRFIMRVRQPPGRTAIQLPVTLDPRLLRGAVLCLLDPRGPRIRLQDNQSPVGQGLDQCRSLACGHAVGLQDSSQRLFPRLIRRRLCRTDRAQLEQGESDDEESCRSRHFRLPTNRRRPDGGSLPHRTTRPTTPSRIPAIQPSV